MAPVQAGPLQTLQRAHHHRVAASCSPRQQSVAAAAPSSRRPDLWHYPAATAGIAALPCRSAGAASSFRSNKARSSVATCAAPQAVQVLELQPATQQQPAEPPDSSLVRGPLPSARPAAPVLNLTPETFSSTLQQDAFVLVDFYTDWCGPCKLMHKEMDRLTQAFPRGVTFCKFNCGNFEEFSTKQRIRSLPTFRLFKGGRMIDQVTGAKPIELRQLLVHYVR